MLELKELLSEFGVDIEKKEIPEDALKALKSALNLINKYSPDFPDDLKSAVGVLAKYAVGYGYPVKKSGKWSSFFGDNESDYIGIEKSDDDGGKKFPSLSRFLNPVSEE